MYVHASKDPSPWREHPRSGDLIQTKNPSSDGLYQMDHIRWVISDASYFSGWLVVCMWWLVLLAPQQPLISGPGQAYFCRCRWLPQVLGTFIVAGGLSLLGVGWLFVFGRSDGLFQVSPNTTGRNRMASSSFSPAPCCGCTMRTVCLSERASSTTSMAFCFLTDLCRPCVCVWSVAYLLGSLWPTFLVVSGLPASLLLVHLGFFNTNIPLRVRFYPLCLQPCVYESFLLCATSLYVHVYEFVWRYMSGYVLICMYISVYPCTYIYPCVAIYVCLDFSICFACIFLCVCVYECICLCVCMCVCVCLCAYMSVCPCL